MKRLCIFYNRGQEWIGRQVEWIVCKKCQQKIVAGRNFMSYLAQDQIRVAKSLNEALKTNKR